MSCYLEKACKGTKLLCNLHALCSKSTYIYESLTNEMLFFGLIVAELVNIDISAGLFRGVVEEAKLGAHEEAAPVEAEAIILSADLRPVGAIEAVEEVGAVCPAHTTHALTLARTEVSIDTEENL